MVLEIGLDTALEGKVRKREVIMILDSGQSSVIVLISV